MNNQQSGNSTLLPHTQKYPFHPLDNLYELQGEGISAKFVFLVIFQVSAQKTRNSLNLLYGVFFEGAKLYLSILSC